MHKYFACLCVCTMCMSDALEGQKRALDFPGTGVTGGIELGSELESSARASSAPN